jgi:hypothetical protein
LSLKVSVLTTGHDKLNITVLLTARSDGFKCRPFVLLARKRPIATIVDKFKNRLALSWKGKKWMDDILTEEYLTTIFGNSLFSTRLLIWDAFRCHTSEHTKQVLKKINLDTAIVPPGCTKYLQVYDFLKYVLFIYIALYFLYCIIGS